MVSLFTLRFSKLLKLIEKVFVRFEEILKYKFCMKVDRQQNSESVKVPTFNNQKEH